MTDLIGKVGICSKGRPGLIQGRKELPWGISWVGTGLDDGLDWASRNPAIVANDITDWCERGKPLAGPTILEEAARLTSSDRNRIYGHPRLHFACTAKMVEAYLIRRGWTPPAGGLLAEDWAQIIGLDKAARQAGNLSATGKLHRDTLVDQAGYARTGEMLEEGLTQAPE